MFSIILSISNVLHEKDNLTPTTCLVNFFVKNKLYYYTILIYNDLYLDEQ
jgi:hypothetical protein